LLACGIHTRIAIAHLALALGLHTTKKLQHLMPEITYLLQVNIRWQVLFVKEGYDLLCNKFSTRDFWIQVVEIFKHEDRLLQMLLFQNGLLRIEENFLI
jgi:hypothetical protein